VGAPEESFGVEAPMPTAARSPSRSDSRPEGGNSSAAELSLPSRAPVSRERPAAAVRAKPSKARLAAIGVGVVALLGGLALQVTPYGAFGYLVATDYLRAGEYARAASSAVRETESAFGTDTYDAAKAAVERVFAAHLRMPRAKSLTAYAAIVDDEAAIRFGADVARASRAKLLVSELSPATPVPYADVALAAQAGEAGHFDVASGALDAASRHYSGDPIDTDILFLRADLALGSGDLATARDAFQRALDRTKSARAHFGLARVLDLAGDTEGAKREIDATLALVPLHPGALVLRARRQSATVDPAHAAADLALVIDGAAHEKASPSDLSNAYAAHAWVALEGGATAEARDAFAQAVKLDPSSVAALDGEGRLFMADGRYTEALARFDTALASSQSFPQAIADDADAKLALERLADAKQQLVAARDRFPKSVPILLTLGRVEQRLGNDDAAEADLRATIAAVDPTRADAVLPYVVLAKLQSSRGRLADAHATLDAAATKLPPSSQLDRAFGEVAELQGDYDGAVARFRAAVVKDPKDLTARFRLAVVLRRQRKYDAAVAVLDRVSAVDADFPGLLLERGMLFEDTGDVQKAIELFKSALARAPDDPDLQLRVGAAYVAIGRAEDALPMLKKTLEKRPGSAEAHHYMGRALLIKGGSYMNDALTYLKRAVELDPNRAEYHIYLARAANEMAPAQLELARDEVDRALALDKAEGDAYWQRGVLERMEGAIDDAMKDEAHALQLRPTRYEAYATLAQCHEDRNETPQAIAAWGRAIQGDNGATGADGEMLHPFWHYRYGKLLYDKGDRASALPHLAGASAAAEKLETRPAWLAPLEFAAAEALRVGGRRVDAIEHYHRFLDLAPISSPDRADAQAALVQLGAPPTR
jgi:tetratricopeptide (TPR) repeat protein